MTLYSYACNYWTWKAPTSCTLWSSTSGFHESEGVLSSAKDCPCHLEGIYFQGTIVATNISPSPPDCGRFLENTKLRPFQLMVAYNSILWLPGMETGGTLMAINVPLFSICDIHTMPSYAARNLNGLSLS